MRKVCGVLAALAIGSSVSIASAERRVVLTDYCKELQLLHEVTKPGLTARSQAVILVQAMKDRRFRQLVEAHREREFQAWEITAALRACATKRR